MYRRGGKGGGGRGGMIQQSRKIVEKKVYIY